MREAWRLVEPPVLARAGARALVGALLGGATGVGLAAAVLGLAGGATPLLERAAYLRDLDRPPVTLRPAWEACLAAGGLAALAALQLLVLRGTPGVGLEAQASGLADLLGRTPSLASLAWHLVLLGVLVGAPSGDVVLARLERRARTDPTRSAVWSFAIAWVFCLLFAIGVGFGAPGPRGPVEVGLHALGGGVLASVFGFIALHVGVLLLLALDGAADALVAAAGLPPSEVERPEPAA